MVSRLTTLWAVGNDEGLELDETDEDEELCEGDKEQVEEDEGEDVRGIQSGGGRQENSLRDYSLKFVKVQWP